jgi:hypothetical protein
MNPEQTRAMRGGLQMKRPFWPTTDDGTFALRLSGLSYVLFALMGMMPALLQVFFQVAAYQSTPGLNESPVWYTNWFAPLSAIAVLGLCLASGVLALIAIIRGKDRGWGLYIALVPMALVLFFLIGEFFIPPFD